jgi:NAD(P)-dependent dehydrogenase (short-subunit alcohol dehydrogenase family)
VGITLLATGDLASRAIRVCTIAPATFDTSLLAELPDDMKISLESSVHHPSRLGMQDEFAHLAITIIEKWNP